MSDASPGQEGLGMSDVIREAIRARMIETHTALPGVIQAFDPATQRADVRIPLLRVFTDLDGDETLEPWPLLSGVRVYMLHGGGFHQSLPVAEGDECMVIFLERDASRWMGGGKDQKPETNRTHDISDGVALVGFNSDPKRIPGYNGSDFVIAADAGGQSVILRANGDVEIESAKLALGAGGEEVLALISEVVGLFAGLTVNTTTGIIITPAAAVITALQARIAAVKV